MNSIYEIAWRDGGRPCRRKVTVVILKPGIFGVHKLTRKWALDHLPTGMLIAYFSSKKLAVECAGSLVASKIVHLMETKESSLHLSAQATDILKEIVREFEGWQG